MILYSLELKQQELVLGIAGTSTMTFYCEAPVGHDEKINSTMI